MAFLIFSCHMSHNGCVSVSLVELPGGGFAINAPWLKQTDRQSYLQFMQSLGKLIWPFWENYSFLSLSSNLIYSSASTTAKKIVYYPKKIAMLNKFHMPPSKAM